MPAPICSRLARCFTRWRRARWRFEGRPPAVSTNPYGTGPCASCASESHVRPSSKTLSTAPWRKTGTCVIRSQKKCSSELLRAEARHRDRPGGSCEFGHSLGSAGTRVFPGCLCASFGLWADSRYRCFFLIGGSGNRYSGGQGGADFGEFLSRRLSS